MGCKEDSKWIKNKNSFVTCKICSGFIRLNRGAMDLGSKSSMGHLTELTISPQLSYKKIDIKITMLLGTSENDTH